MGLPSIKIVKHKLAVALLYPAFVIGFALAPQAATIASAACDPPQSVLGLPTWYKYLEGEEVAGKCTPKVRPSDDDDPEGTVNLVLPIGVALLEIGASLGALVAFVMVLWGSFNFVTSIGESDKAASARKTVQNSAIGLVILLISARVIDFFGNLLM